jgi:putative ABC transport system permease protein
MLTDLLQDLRVGTRNLLRAPILMLTIVLTVGLGIGATTAIFAAIHAALLKPLPYPEPDRLVRLYTDAPPNRFRFSLVDYQAFEAQQTHFERIAAYTDRSMAFSDGQTAVQLRGRVVTWGFFGVLRLTPALGRDFVESEGRPGAPPAVIVSDAIWRQHLGARPDAIGQPMRLDGRAYTVVGVLPPPAGPLERRDFFAVAQFEPPRRKGPFTILPIARLRAGADRTAAANELRAIARRLFPLWKSSYQDERATWGMMDLKAFAVGDVTTIAGLALAAVALVWLIASVNASNLLIARVTSRRRELAVRAALGASRGRVMRHLLAESVVLAAGSAAVGLAVAWTGMRLLRSVGALYFPRTQEIALSGSVLWVLAASTIASAVLFGLVPAMSGSGGPPDAVLRTSGRSATGNVAVRRLRRALVGTQFAVATPLLVVAGLLIGSLNELRRVDLGFDTRGVLMGVVQLPTAQFQDPGRTAAFWDELRRRIEALPGIAGVAFANGGPPDAVNDFNNFDLEERPATAGESQPVTPWVSVSPEYFGTLGLPLIEGRLLTEDDAKPEFLESVVVDGAWVKRFFPGRSAIGKRFKSGGCTECPWTTVVGVVSEVKYAGVDKPDEGTVYTPMARNQSSRYLIVRTHADPSAAAPVLRETLRRLDPMVPMTDLATIDERTARSLERPRSLSLLVALFAIVALVLASVGIYGVMAYYVQQQAKDISIRLALGGTPRDVVRLVVGQGMTVVAAGVALGLGAAFFLARWMSSLLFGVGASDPVTFAAAALFLAGVALVACLVPAWRATRFEPAAVLRNE